MANVKMTNSQYWDYARAIDPNFKSHTAEATADLFTEKGFDRMKALDPSALSDYFYLTIRMVLQYIDIQHAKDPFDEQDFGVSFSEQNGGILQRMAVDSVKPINPSYKGLVDGDSPDPFIVRKPSVSERFFDQNFDYQSLITIPDDFQYKLIFTSTYGMDQLTAGITEGLQNGYTIQKYNNKLEALNAAINDATLRASQKIVCEMSDAPTEDEMKNMLKNIADVISSMKVSSQTSGYNAMGYASVQDTSMLRLIVRPGLLNYFKYFTKPGIYHPDSLNFPEGLKIVEANNFGGLVPYKEAAFTTPLYPVYDKLGAQIGFATTKGSGTVEVETSDAYWKDPNENVTAILADKRIIFENTQNPYTVETIRNPRGKYTNLWAASMNNTIKYDKLYNMVLFTKS